MTHKLLTLLFTGLLFCVSCQKPLIDDPNKPGGKTDEGNKTEILGDLEERNGQSGITYQLLVYTFADSDGDGIGDINGITSKLDYLKEMGVSALWLSPIHPSASYHGYDVKDYNSINPELGTEEDFKNLLNVAHSKGIKIYLDYVLNHTSREHPWFLDAKSSKDSPYRNYYIFSDNPADDIKNGRIPQIATEGSSGYDKGQWFTAVSGGSQKLKIRFTLKLSNGKPSTLTAENLDSGIATTTSWSRNDKVTSSVITTTPNIVTSSGIATTASWSRNDKVTSSVITTTPNIVTSSGIATTTSWSRNDKVTSADIATEAQTIMYEGTHGDISSYDGNITTNAAGTGVWLYYGNGSMKEFNKQDETTLTLSLEFESDWGVLVRTSQTQWDSYKYGGTSGNNQLVWGVPLKLVNSNQTDILLPGMTGTMYHSHFWTDWFADLNYGSAETCESSPAFIEVCKSADKWINMGIDGFRLDAIKHIYHNANSDENPTFLKKFYDHCNATYKAAGGVGDIYMVGEHFSEAREVAPYYKGLPAFFEFSFWWRLKDAINSGKGSNFASTIISYTKEYAKYRSNYIAATKLTNHDEDRAGSDLSSNRAKMKLAGAVLLTAGGQPYIYQGEELGYTGTKSGGDEYVRTPILWTKGGKMASKKLGGKTRSVSDNQSVEAQSGDDTSIFTLYKKFGDLRDRYLALSKGKFESCNIFNNEAICAYYRTHGTQRILVIHNFSASLVKFEAGTASLNKVLATNGSVAIKDRSLTLGGHSTVLLIQ